MAHSHLNRIADAQRRDASASSRPTGATGMIEHARDFAARRHPVRLRSRARACRCSRATELLELHRTAPRALTVNDYEARIVEQKTGRSVAEIAGDGRRRSSSRAAARARPCYTGGRQIDGARALSPRRSSIPPAAATPTAPGCSTAWRAAGTGSSRARLASVMGSIKIAHRGGQNHRPSRAEIARTLPRGVRRSTLKEESA